jgi:hypothetical protein
MILLYFLSSTLSILHLSAIYISIFTLIYILRYNTTQFPNFILRYSLL